MSRYGELYETALSGQKYWSEYRDRSFRNLHSIVRALVAYCEIPGDKITYLLSNNAKGEARRYRESEDGQMYSIPGAARFDTDDGHWHLGVSVTLTPSGTFPERWVGFVLCITENDEGKLMVKIGPNGKPRQIDLTNPAQSESLCDDIFQVLNQRPQYSRKSSSRALGFMVGTC